MPTERVFMNEEFIRAELLLGTEAMERLFRARVLVFGVGGVGSFAAEALARAGIGTIGLVDDDEVNITNINRQLPALHSTLGMKKAEVMRARILDINPRCSCEAHTVFYGTDTADLFDLSQYDYILDAIDSVFAKLLLIERAALAGVPIVSSMGAGNKLDPARLEVADIYETSVCPLARVMRRELKKRGICALRVVYSKEEALKPRSGEGEGCAPTENARRQTPGSVSFVPPVAGFMLAGVVVKALAFGEPRTSS